jgi:membrane-associated HD superfamily phosphohydrolase
VNRETPEGSGSGRLRGPALIAALTGAAGSVGLLLRAGRRNDSRLLMVLMAMWVLSPFVALVWAHMVSKRWPVLTRSTLYSLMLVLTVASLAIYSDAVVSPPKAQGAFVFVVVPPVSWLLAAVALLTAALLSSRRSRRPDDI